MLYKTSKPQTKKFIRKAATVLFIAEGLVFVGSYGVWHKLNTDRDFRKYMRGSFPSTLDIYYSLQAKTGGISNLKQIDFAYWDNQKE